MVNLDKMMTKEEFEKLVKSKYGFLITYWYELENGKKADYYVSNIHGFNEKESELSDKNKLEIFNLLKAEELNKINEISYDSIFGFTDNNKLKQIKIETLKELITNYYKDKINDPDFLLSYGYLAGICALSSYLLRINDISREDTIDDLFNAHWSLFYTSC